MAVLERKAREQQTQTTRADSLVILADILCGLDGTRTAYEAVRQAAVLAQPNGHLTLLAVTGGHASEGKRNAIEQATIAPARARRVLYYAERLAREKGVRAKAQLEERGPVRRILLERAREHTLLALGAPAMSRHAHILIGGVASAAAHTLPASLLIARRPPNGVTFAERILIASDALACSDDLVHFAVGLARARGAELVLLHAAGAESRFQPTRIARQAELLADALGERGALRVVPGRANAVIVTSAAQERASLVVLGSRRVGGLRALGSVSERVVHDAPCSVLVVRPEDLGA